MKNNKYKLRDKVYIFSRGIDSCVVEEIIFTNNGISYGNSFDERWPEEWIFKTPKECIENQIELERKKADFQFQKAEKELLKQLKEYKE